MSAPENGGEGLPELHPLDYITADAIHDLWGIGYTIVKRARHPDPFFVPPEVVPQGRSYQWMHLVHDRIHYESGWAAVPNSRHEGMFMPFGTGGNIEVSGLGLFEKPKFEVDQERAQQLLDAQRPLQDWADKYRDLTGGARTLAGSEVIEIDTTGLLKRSIANFDAPPDRGMYGDANTKTIDTTVAIPKDMVPHMAAIFAERDRLKDEVVMPDRTLKPGELAEKFYAAVEADQSLPWWPTLHAILLPIAIENVRREIRAANVLNEAFKEDKS